jgi:uncharacterized membrane protein
MGMGSNLRLAFIDTFDIHCIIEIIVEANNYSPLLIGLVADGRTLSSLFEPTAPWLAALLLIFGTGNCIRNFRDQKRRLNSRRYANERII